MTAEYLASPGLRAAHGFFTRQGGVSGGVYASLNGGTGSRDDRAAVLENRRRMAKTLGVAPDRLVLPYLVHSPDAVTIDTPFDEADRPSPSPRPAPRPPGRAAPAARPARRAWRSP